MTDKSPETGEPANKAFAAQRHRISELERLVEDLQGKIDEQDSGDPTTAGLKKQIRDMERRIDQLSLQGVDNEKIEEVMAEFPWIKSISNKAERIQAVKDIIDRTQRVETNAGDPHNTGRSKSEAATQAHLTGGGPSAGGASSRSDYDRDYAKFEKDMGEAKNQTERNALADAWSQKYPDERPL